MKWERVSKNPWQCVNAKHLSAAVVSSHIALIVIIIWVLVLLSHYHHLSKLGAQKLTVPCLIWYGQLVFTWSLHIEKEHSLQRGHGHNWISTCKRSGGRMWGGFFFGSLVVELWVRMPSSHTRVLRLVSLIGFGVDLPARIDSRRRWGGLKKLGPFHPHGDQGWVLGCGLWPGLACTVASPWGVNQHNLSLSLVYIVPALQLT